ncbi:MAG: SOS response-associated peptidase [Polyangiaceae bacterium]
MCGRTTLSTSPADLRAAFGLEEMPELGPRYNVAPSQPIAVLREPRRLELLRWGLASKPGAHSAGINVRIETVARAPAYRSSFQTRRCLIVVDGFFEWRRQGKASQPFLLRRPDGKPFALAGIWDRSVTADGEVVEACAVITRAAEGPVAEIHDRMPLILVPEQYDAWLDRRSHDASRLLVPGAMELVAGRVSTVVNSPANDDPRCIAPPEEDASRQEDTPGQTGWSF